MATDFDRDDQIDRLLEGARRDGSTELVAGPACLDAEGLAAWADGTLPADERQSVETHLAECARCQRLLAVFATSDEAVGSLAGAAAPAQASAPASVVPFRRRSVKVWLPVAAGTIAATLLVSIVVRDRGQVPETLTANSDSVGPAVPAPAPQPLAQGGSASGQQAKADAASRDLESTRASQARPAAEKSGKRLDAIEEVRTRPAQPQERALARRAEPTPAAVPVPLPPPPAAPPPPPLPVVTPTPSPIAVTAASPVIQTAAQAAEARANANAVSFLPGVADPTLVVAQFSSSDAQGQVLGGIAGGIPDRAAAGGRGGGGRGGAGGVGAGAAQSAPTFRSAVAVLHWRVMASGQVQRSPDAKTWEPVRIDPPVPGLTGGTAPSSLVCWLIGRAGVVLLSTDGVQFNRVTSPTAANLTSIRATDAMQATVTAADGRAYTTTDGGKTWKRN